MKSREKNMETIVKDEKELKNIYRYKIVAIGILLGYVVVETKRSIT